VHLEIEIEVEVERSGAPRVRGLIRVVASTLHQHKAQ